MKMKNIILSLLLLVSTNSALASASGSMNTTGISSGVNSAANAAYGNQNAARCSGRRPSACVRAMLGYAQMGLSLLQMLSTMRSRDALSPGTDWSLPNLPTDFDTLPDGLDNYVSPLADAVRTGRLSDFEKMKNRFDDLTKANIEKLEKLGYKYDAEKGTITTPTGTHDMKSLAASLNDGSVGDYVDKLNAALGIQDSNGGVMTAADQAAKANFERNVAAIDDFSKNSVDNFLKNLDQGKIDNSKLSGMSVNTRDGDAIGVAMGNLFKTIHSKYKALTSKEEFK